MFTLSSVACSSPAPVLKKQELQTTPTNVLPSDWGKTFTAIIRSSALGSERKVHILLPSTFDETKQKYPVIYVLDGEHYFQRAATAVRQLYRSGHMPEAIVAAIETPERRQDMTPPGMSAMHSDGLEPRGEKFLKFMVNELKPQLEVKFRAGGPSVLMGHSHGGILGVYAAARWRQDLPFHVILDAPVSLDDNWLANELVESIPSKGNLRLVSLETKFGWQEEDWSRLTRAAPKNWKLSRIKMQGEDHETMVFAGFFQGLKEIFSDYSAVAVKNLSGDQAFEHYRKLEASYGAPVMPPQFVLERAVRDLTFLGKGDLARTALTTWAEGYGEPQDQAQMLAEIKEAEEGMKGQETVEQLLALKPPTAAEMQPYLGDWKGHSWVTVDENRKMEFGVTFSLENGHGVAKISNPGAPLEFRSLVARYLRVTPTGVEFGNMNGMTPRGIVANVGRITGDRLEGESVFKGVFVKERPFRRVFVLQRVK